jgi:hypothetical protein
MSIKVQKIFLWIAVGIMAVGVCFDGIVADWITHLCRCIGGIYIFGSFAVMVLDVAIEYKEKINVIYNVLIEEDEDEQRED